MNTSFSFVIMTIMFITINWYLHQIELEDDKINSPRPTQARISKFIFFIGMILLLNKHNIKIPTLNWLLFVLEVIISLSICFYMMNIVWKRIEYVVMVGLPIVISDTSELFGQHFQIEQGTFSPLLIIISLTFLSYSILCNGGDIVLLEIVSNENTAQHVGYTSLGKGDADQDEVSDPTETDLNSSIESLTHRDNTQEISPIPSLSSNSMFIITE
ncbi:hypothetical protein J6590_001513 [Homalodisca vitripennis]|nr:hypothetical protein J6590_001513 [Homalodisca vitripennis]